MLVLFSTQKAWAKARFAVPLGMGSMYQFDSGLIWIVHTNISVYCTVPCFGLLVQFDIYRTNDRSVHWYGLVRRTMC